MDVLVDSDLLMEMEAKAVEMAWESGRILEGHFGKPMDVDYKDDGKNAPVTPADIESQAYLSESIVKTFPGHGIVGEEDSEEKDGSVPDFLWVLDPLDGTTNFLNGLPIYAVSICALHRGVPVAGSIYIPWPGDKGGSVLHARKGSGASIDGEPLSIPESPVPEASRLSGLPGSFGARFRPRKDLRRRLGEPRVTGSVAYELALTATGAFQYVVFGGPRIWDVAAGALIVKEAGGEVLGRRRKETGWEVSTSLGPSWAGGPPTVKQVRSWRSRMIAGNPPAARFVAANLEAKYPLAARVADVARKLGRGAG